VHEAPLGRSEHGLVPETDGWFVLNAKDAVWLQNEDFGRYTRWEGDGDARFREVGINVSRLRPGQSMCLYHAEDAQEDFLVLAGEAVLLVEGEERPLRAWDLVHCPAWTRHVVVAAGTEPLVVLAVGARNGRRGLLYPADETAQRHGAGVARDTGDGAEAYASSAPDVPGAYVEGDLPG
jgi:uncharacterized cupin superfamily protein